MNPRSSRSSRPGRRRRAGRSVTCGGVLRRLLSLPARLHLRWLVILLVMMTALGAYGHVLATAPPMPPSQAPSRAPGVAPSEGVGADATAAR